MSEKSDEWQLVVVGVSDQDDIDHGNSPNPCRDAKTLAEFARCMGFCSEPVVFAERSPVDEDAQQNLQKGLTEKLTEAAKKMRDKNIKKLMVYYAGHGESVGESRTVSVDLDLVLEEAVVSAVEENELKYVCVIVLLDCCRNKAEDSPACKTGTFPSESNTYVYVYFGELYYPLRNSSLVPAALMHMIQAQSDCTISDFLLRMSQLLLQVTLGRINMEWAGLSRSNAALWPFFPAGRVCLLDREQVDVMPQQHYDALRNTFCVYGCLDCIVDYAVSLPMMLKDTKVMLKDKEKQLSASKPKLRHAIPSYGCLDCIMDCAKSLSVMLKGTKAKLKNVEADPEILREDEEIQLPASPTLRHMIPELRSIAESFFGKTYLFLDDWRQELDVAMCESLEEVEETLEKVAQEPGPSASFSNLQQRLPDSLRRCVLNARRDCYRRHQREGLMHTDHVIEVLQTLECYFDKLPLSAKESLEIKELDAEEGRKDEIPVLYAFVINDISASGIPEQQLRDLEKIVDSVDGKDVVKYGSRFFLSTGSLWIILQSAKLDDKTFRSVHRQLEAWTKQLRQSRAAWHAARLQVVPRPAVPAGLQKLVHELCAANLATGPVVQPTADHVRELVAKRRGVSPSRLHVFEGERSARGWLQRGDLRFTEAKDWKVLMQDINPSLSESLQTLAERTVGRQLWGDSAEFQGAAFLLHHRRAHLSAAQMGEVKCPEEFLIWVIQQELTLCCAQATPSSCWGGTLSMNNLLLSPEAEVPALAPPAWLASEGRGNFFTTAPWPASSASGLELRTATLPRDLAVVDLCELPGPKLLSCFAFQDGRCSLPGGDLQIYELPGALVHLRWEKSAGRWKVWASAAGVSVLLSTLETPDPQLVLRTSSENVDCLDLCFIPLPGPEPQRRNVSKAEDSVGVLGSPVETKV